jgi:hypothetical protein
MREKKSPFAEKFVRVVEPTTWTVFEILVADARGPADDR